MRKTRVALCAIFLGACAPSHVAHSRAATLQLREKTTADVSRDSVFSLHNGTNVVDLLGDGSKAEISVAWRANYNAHGHSTVAFHVLAPSDRDENESTWQVVPFFGATGDVTASTTGRDEFTTTEGADCILGDIRVVQHNHKPVDVVIAHRELGASFADSAAVTFDYYVLVRNTDAEVGWPTYYFKRSRTVRATRAWCDVNTAFDRELGLGTVGVGHAEGGR